MADEVSQDEQARMLRQHLLLLSQANTRIREAMQYADESIMVVVARDNSMNQEHIPDKEKVLMLKNDLYRLSAARKRMNSAVAYGTVIVRRVGEQSHTFTGSLTINNPGG